MHSRTLSKTLLDLSLSSCVCCFEVFRFCDVAVVSPVARNPNSPVYKCIWKGMPLYNEPLSVGDSTGKLSRRAWTANSNGTLTPELTAVNPESIPSRTKVETITHSLSAWHSHARWAFGGGNGFLGPVGHRQMMNPSVMNLEHRPSWISVDFSFD